MWGGPHGSRMREAWSGKFRIWGLEKPGVGNRLAGMDQRTDIRELVPDAAVRLPPFTEIIRSAVVRYGPILQGPELEGMLARLAARPVRGVLEIGSFHGGSLACWAQVSTGPLVSLDFYYPAEKKEVRDRKWVEDFGDRVKVIEADSQDPETVLKVELAMEPPDYMVDFLFIDGKHKDDGALQDYRRYAGFVRAGGMIAFHDIRHGDFPEIGQHWKAIRDGKRWEEIEGSTAIGVIHVE